MTIFKTYLKILSQNKLIVIIYTIILLFFGAFNMKTSDSNLNFTATKPDILIINHDSNTALTTNFIEFLTQHNNIKDITPEEDSINDALFYREVNYVIYIPKNFSNAILNHKNPNLEIKSTGDYNASLAEMLTNRYLSLATIYAKYYKTEKEIITHLNSTLDKDVPINLTTKLDTDTLSRTNFYFNFASYTILAGCVYIISIIIASFKERNIAKRTIISGTNYRTLNRKLLLSSSLLALTLWFLYCLLSFVLLGSSMFSIRGMFYLLNSLVFTLCALSLAFLISNLTSNKNAINGLVNVIALGSSFLCGAFVPLDFLPPGVLKIASFLPSYYYIQNNELLATLDNLTPSTLKPFFFRLLILLIMITIFIIVTNIVSKHKRQMS